MEYARSVCGMLMAATTPASRGQMSTTVRVTSMSGPTRILSYDETCNHHHPPPPCPCGRAFPTARGLAQHQARTRHLCRRCGGEQTEADREVGRCTQCGNQ